MKTYIDNVLEEFDLFINDRELELDFYGHITTLPIPETLKDVCKKFIKQKLQERDQDLIKKLAGEKVKPSILSLGVNSCPQCGLEVNRDWVDNQTRKIKKEGIDRAIEIIKRER